jgi:hypothetical protein
VFRVPAPGHGSLAHWLGKIVDLIRVVLGDSAKQLLLVFDRGGAFPSAMAELRGRSVEFVTYERAPYPLLTDTAFDRVMRVRRGQRIEQVRFTEGERKNLREGRGRVRRIVLKMQDGRQVNVLAVSKLSAPTLVRTLLARWGYQENQFKHEVERWGINQLDGRRVEPYPEDAIIPNPARRLLDFRLRLAYAEEGRLRRRIARVTDDRKRQDYEHQLHRVLDHQRELLELRPSVPKHAPVSETSLAGVLVRHTPDYKYALDGLRVALANIESELAAKLAVALPRGTEAKKTLANLLMAPGVVRVNKYATRVILAPAASAQERKAFRALLRDVNRLRLTLPGDPERRIMRFEVQ